MVVVPAATPVTIPVPEPMVATPVAELTQLPPAVAFVRVIVCPAQTLEAPTIADSGLTVSVDTAKQPVGIV